MKEEVVGYVNAGCYLQIWTKFLLDSGENEDTGQFIKYLISLIFNKNVCLFIYSWLIPQCLQDTGIAQSVSHETFFNFFITLILFRYWRDWIISTRSATLFILI